MNRRLFGLPLRKCKGTRSTAGSIILDRRRFLVATTILATSSAKAFDSPGQDSEAFEGQPYFASVERALQAMRAAGQPASLKDTSSISHLARRGDAYAIAETERILDHYTFARVLLDKEGTGQAVLGGADRILIEGGWKSFLVRVSNPEGVTARFEVSSARGVGQMSGPNAEARAALLDTLFKAPLVERLWLTAKAQESQPLSGAGVEYKVIDIFCRDAGRRNGELGFGAGSFELDGDATKRADFASWKHPLTFDAFANPTANVELKLLDDDGVGCMASIIVEDMIGHIYPPQTMRLAPDMFFHPHIYRADGETIRLPDGPFKVTAWRGPEYLRVTSHVVISQSIRTIHIALKRWIDPAVWGWYSGDTHIHAAGCAHYVHPTEGVSPETMIRHVRGEGLSIGEVLTWGPAWYYQKGFFSGHSISPLATLEHGELQVANNVNWLPRPTAKDNQSLLRYDMEVSQFPSSICGHLVLLRLRTQDYPGTSQIEDWPSWNLPILRWAKAQGACVGFAHCGLGMTVSDKRLPNYDVPKFDSIGTNEAIVDVTHNLCDFLSGCEFEPAEELNAWYHMLNCGFQLAMLGETDYPCITGERPGVGRSYVQLKKRPTEDAGYNDWIDGIMAGRLYSGDGRSHFLKISVNGHSVGDTLRLEQGGNLSVLATVAARLEPEPTSETRMITAGWHLERARIGETRSVPLELVVNGYPVDRIELEADGKPRQVELRASITQSSWVALRILPSCHSHPIFLSVGDKPIRASRRSAEWLRKSVDALWREKFRMIRPAERSEAGKAYDHARTTFDRLIAQSIVD